MYSLHVNPFSFTSTQYSVVCVGETSIDWSDSPVDQIIEDEEYWFKAVISSDDNSLFQIAKSSIFPAKKLVTPVAGFTAPIKLVFVEFPWSDHVKTHDEIARVELAAKFPSIKILSSELLNVTTIWFHWSGVISSAWVCNSWYWLGEGWDPPNNIEPSGYNSIPIVLQYPSLVLIETTFSGSCSI